ncbi:MAG TPA: exopolysaccharide Pel transporter PelG [Candidatus Mediterraneibacter cottocaccae]|nr:exopolysaccharide Pel transporter PelG [Candidatus Mediterraneibacter cottocaccae]
MAGIGIKLNRIFKRHTLVHTLYGSGYSMLATVTPMLVVIGTMLLMYIFLGFDSVRYYDRELFSCTILYVFIFSLLAASPFNSVLSKYVGDRIFEERYEDILPCIYVGLALNMGLAALIGIPFHIWAYVVGEIPLYWVFTAFCAYIGLGLCFYQMLYLSIVKAYKKISLFFFLGMLLCFVLSLVFRFLLNFSVTYSMLLAMTLGFFLIACLEFGFAKSYFCENSHHYREVLRYFRVYWKLIFTNFFYILGLYIHNFVFWTKDDMNLVLADTYICNQPYDMATCIAMFTNLSASVIFIAYVEMHFHKRYQDYTEAVLGGRLKDIVKAQKRMFRLMGDQLMRVTQLQYIISVVLFLLCIILLPRMGMTGLVMTIYPCLAAGYFVLFLLYTVILFLQYFNDLTGSALTSLIFVAVTGIVSVFARDLPDYWYGIGVFVGSILAWSFAYGRLRWLERHLEEHTFCRGTLLERADEPMPDSKVYDLREIRKKQKEEEHAQ